MNFNKKGLLKMAAAGVSVFISASLLTVVNADEHDEYSINLIVDGRGTSYATTEDSVGLFFEKNGIEFGENAVISADLSDKIYDGMDITVQSNEDKVVTKSEIINYKTVIEYSNDIETGKSKITTAGVDGKKLITTTTKFINGEAQEPDVKEEIVIEPVDQVVTVGTKKSIIPDTDMEYSKVIEMNASAYAPVVECCGKNNGITADGSKAEKGVVAVDPNVIPLGTKLYIPGYGVCVAHDTGGAIKGNKIDLCYDTYNEALNFGRKNISVYILK